MSSAPPVHEDYRPLPMQTEFIGRNMVEIKPVSNDYNINTIQISVPNNIPNHLIDCSKIELVTKANILKSDGTMKLAKTVTNVGVVNNVLYSMWSNVNVELNNKRVTAMMASIPTLRSSTFTNMDGNKVERQADTVTETVKDDTGASLVAVIETLDVEENYMAKRMAGYFQETETAQEPIPILMV